MFRDFLDCWYTDRKKAYADLWEHADLMRYLYLRYNAGDYQRSTS